MPRMRYTCAAVLISVAFAGPVAAKQAAISGTGGAAVEAFGQTAERGVTAPAPWIQEDPGARAYLAARDHLNARQYRDAANAFYQLRRDYPQSGYLADSYYYQAFALSRQGGRSQLREARELLDQQMAQHPTTGTLADARELRVRVESQLAQQGDAQAAQAITQQAQEACGPEQEMRLAALNALMNMNPERAMPLLQEVLRDRDACSAELRQHAVFLIAQQMTDETVDILMDLAHRNPDPDPEVRQQAVFWLSEVDSPEALAALQDILADSDDIELQRNALFAIAQHDMGGDGQILREFAQRTDVSTELRAEALFWIGETDGGAQYLRSIFGSLNDTELRSNALHAIAQEEDPANRDWLVALAKNSSEDMEVRTEALFWAAEAGAFEASELRGLFSSFTDAEMKEQVIFAASQRDDRESVDFLMEVAENPENGELREQAIFWLGQSDDSRIPEFLLRIIGR